MRKTGVAVIGYGGMGSWHCAKIQDIETVKLVGTYDILESRRKAAAEKGIRTYASLEALLADPEVEVVTVAIPNQLHKPVCIQAMQAGKHVVCEKPVALNHEELQDMIDTQHGAEVDCHFCLKRYKFNEEDLKTLLQAALIREDE